MNPTIKQNYSKQKNIIILIATIWNPLFWYVANTINPYRYILTGIVFELLWFPMILLQFAIPIVSLIFWHQEKWRLNTVYPYCTIIMIAVIIYMRSH